MNQGHCIYLYVNKTNLCTYRRFQKESSDSLQLGWCWETTVRVAFPDEIGNYTGYKVGHSETEDDGVILNHE